MTSKTVCKRIKMGGIRQPFYDYVKQCKSFIMSNEVRYESVNCLSSSIRNRHVFPQSCRFTNLTLRPSKTLRNQLPSCEFSRVPGDSTISNRESSLDAVILISLRAKRCPMHTRGPPGNQGQGLCNHGWFQFQSQSGR